jgi:hypothetical protein
MRKVQTGPGCPGPGGRSCTAHRTGMDGRMARFRGRAQSNRHRIRLLRPTPQCPKESGGGGRPVEFTDPPNENDLKRAKKTGITGGAVMQPERLDQSRQKYARSLFAKGIFQIAQGDGRSI